MEGWADRQHEGVSLPGGIVRPGRQRRQDAGTVQLTERDVKGLTWVGQQYAVRLDHLQVMLGRWAVRPTEVEGVVGRSTADRIIARWRRAGWVEAKQILAKEPIWVWLTRPGLQHMGLPYRPWEAKAAALNHVYWCNAARLWVEWRDVEKGRQGVWIGERHLRYEVEQAERGLRSEQGQVSRKHLPDGEAVYGTTRIGVEVELTAKVPKRALSILKELVREYQAVWYFVRPATRGVIDDVVRCLPAEQQRQVSVIDLD